MIGRTELFDLPLAIVDVETTGQSAMLGKVIEVAVVRVEQGKVVRRFETLVNPERYISPAIEALTGIRNQDVAEAPAFASIARRLEAILEGALFVAHNARFDYTFLKAELAAVGRPFSARCLCTVKLSRRLFPEHRHHDLSTVIERCGLTTRNRHRAAGDAEAVLAFLRYIDESCEPARVSAALKQVLKSSRLPSGLEPGVLDRMPESPGVYAFYGSAGELLYIGKSINIRERVRSHFSGDGSSSREMEMCMQVRHVEAHPTPGELGALLLESRMIKELSPIYNRMSRRRHVLIAARQSLNRHGYMVIDLEETEYIDPAEATSIMAIFKSKKQAQEYLAGVTRSHSLCQKLLGLDQSRGACFAYHLHQCRGACLGEEDVHAYNRRVDEAFAERRIRSWPYAGGIVIEERSGPDGECEIFVVDNWCLVASYRSSGDGFDRVTAGSHRFDYDGYKILLRYLTQRRGPGNVRPIRREELEAMRNDLRRAGG